MLCVAVGALVLGSAFVVVRTTLAGPPSRPLVSPPNRLMRTQLPIATPTAVPGISPATAACQWAGGQRCAPLAHYTTPTRFPLAAPDPAGAHLLTRAQILSMPGFADDTVTASLMTYRQPHAAFPELAAEGPLVVNPDRLVWVVTAYFPHPLTVPFCRYAICPAGVMSRRLATIAASSQVLDAATGDASDQCTGCAVLPPPRATTPIVHHLLPPSNNHVSGQVTVPRTALATLSPSVMRWLRREGISYVVPRVPARFASVTKRRAARAAAAQTPVGRHPTIRALALISPVTAIHPLTAHSIVWAVVLSPVRSPHDTYYVTFVDVRTPTVVGALFHKHSTA